MMAGAGSRARASWRRRVSAAGLVGVLVGGLVGVPAGASAQEAAPAEAPAKPAASLLFMGIPVTPASGIYAVHKDVNLRGGPSTDSEKLDMLNAGDRIEAVGRTGDDWIAVRRDDTDLGFVFEPMLLPLVDGALDDPLEGAAAAGDGTPCRYEVTFEGKTPVDDELFEVSDYVAAVRCSPKGRTAVAVTAYLFLVEGPAELDEKPLYQLGLDVRELDSSFSEVFSTVLLWDRTKGTVAFDSMSQPDYTVGALPAPREAASEAEALHAAVAVALASWNGKVWPKLRSGS